MGGFEIYFAAAMREKKVPVQLTLDKETAQYFVVSTEPEWHGFVYGSGGSQREPERRKPSPRGCRQLDPRSRSKHYADRRKVQGCSVDL
jgi:hypothetical protein